MKRKRFRVHLGPHLPMSVILAMLLAATLLLLSACASHSQAEHPSDGSVAASTYAETYVLPETTGARFSDSESTGTQAQPETEPESDDPSETETAAVSDDSWKLLLVNADHPLPADFTVTLKELRNGHHVDERIYPELQQMFDDARAVGIYPFINESFRTAERQQEIMDKYIANYEASGMSHEQAVEKALTIVAVPGTSEHQLGLALDIIAEYDADSTATWQWLKENSWRYGFILRYPAEKEAITGITYEPWHFRYVGVDAAREITERGICLEEYHLEEPPE